MATSSTVNQTNQVYGAQGNPIQANFPVPVIATRAPTTADINYTIGRQWIDKSAASIYFLGAKASGSATWIAAGSGATGGVVTVTGDSGGAISPVAGNVDILGGSGVTVAGSAGTLTISLTGGGTAIDSFVPDAGTNPVVPTALGAVTMAGTANQITTTGGLNSLTFSLPAAITAPGSLTTTTTLTGGTGITATTGNIVASTGNITSTLGSMSAATTVTAGTGVTATTGNILASGGDIITTRSSAGADVTIEATNSDNTSGTSRAGVEIATGGASSGDPYLSFQISGVGASTMTMGLDNSASDILVISNSATVGTSNALTLTQAGALGATTSITAGTTLTATLGDITATNGNIVRGTAGNKDVYSSVASTTTAGANSAGTVTLAGGTATVSTTAVTASSQIRLYRQGIGSTGAAALGILTLGTVVAATSFVINAVQAADATALQASDVSVIGWEIVN